MSEFPRGTPTTERLEMKKITLAVALAAIALSACSSTNSAEPAPVVTVTAPAPEPKVDEEALFWSVFDNIWADLSTTEKQDMCLGLAMFPDDVLAAFKDGADGSIPSGISDSDLLNKFEDSCEGY
jgi:hypothetical protein